MNGFIWITAAISLCCSAGAWVYSSGIMEKRDSEWKALAAFALVSALSGAAVRYTQMNFPNDLIGLGIEKFCASLPTMLFALRGYLSGKDRFSGFILLAIVLGLFADVSINSSIAAGGLFFAVGHAMYDVAFVHEKKPSKKQIVIWLVLSVLMIIPGYLFREKIGSLPLLIAALVYVSILISTIVFSWSLERLVFIAACVFAVSDVFMAVNLALKASMYMMYLSLIVYYFSLFLYGIVIWKRTYRKTA